MNAEFNHLLGEFRKSQEEILKKQLLDQPAVEGKVEDQRLA